MRARNGFLIAAFACTAAQAQAPVAGAYVANVQVEIADARGKPILETVCDAPIMLVNLPTARSYRIRAEVAGRPVNKAVRVRSGRTGTAVGITWPSGLSASDPDLQGFPPPG